MPARRLSMRKIKEVLRLKYGLRLKNREIARSCSIPRSTVANYLIRAEQAGINTWPLSPDLEEEALERLLFPPTLVKVERPRCVLPDFAWMRALAFAILRIPDQVGHPFRRNLATDSGMKLATCSGAKLATFRHGPEWVANMNPE